MNSIETPTTMAQTEIADRKPVAISALQLLGPARIVVIEHKGERYELRLTRNDKLILTK